jgi:2-polyprenyl-6-methoxyphenol hydroxylase-like FAD-dependent oxidoreductase
MSGKNMNVAIIGAGLSGLALALGLYDHGISCTVFESRPGPLNIGGAVMLSPNALKVLDSLHVYAYLKNQGFNFSQLHYRDISGNLLETYEFGNKDKYGYEALRIYRTVLIDTLLEELKRKNIPIKFGAKFTHIIKEDSNAVTFAFADGSTETADLLVGADGIHSRVRKYLYPDLEPKFIGMAGTTAAVPTAQLKLPEGYHLPVTITSPQGAFVIAPQQIDGSEVLIGKQRRVAEQDRAAWEKTLADKEDAVRFLQQDQEHFSEIVRNAVSHINHEKINVWPFFVVPKLDKWASEKRRVIILGDAAHAIPPSAGQGINQAFEDVYILSLLLGRSGEIGSLQDALSFWQSYRQDRVDKVFELNKQIDLRRMPANDAFTGEGSGVQREEFDLEWLYKPDFNHVVDEWILHQEP